MSVVRIHRREENALPEAFPFFTAGFRPFFLGAALYAVVSMTWWMGVYVFHLPFTSGPLPPHLWHAHEMIYGYGGAVIGGFLLTAITNWTGLRTASGAHLCVLFSVWTAARILTLSGAMFRTFAAVCDLLFFGLLCIAVASPLLASKQWKQSGIATKVLLLFAGNCLFYLGASGAVSRGVEWSIHGGLYLIVSLILTIAGRVFPGFIENGVEEDVRLANPRWLSIATLAVFLVFFVNQLFLSSPVVLLSSAGALCVLTTIRLILWHTKGIWKHPLVWSLYLALASIDVGFLLFAFSAFGSVSPLLAIHAFASGGIGLATLGMMARVTLGHTGRSVHAPPSSTAWACRAMACAVIFRVLLPLLAPGSYQTWIASAQVFWVISFAVFLYGYAGFLVSPEHDGKQTSWRRS